MSLSIFGSMLNMGAGAWEFLQSPQFLTLLWQVPIGLGVLSFLVLVHEAGHFIVARRNGVTVKAFSIGFGPRLFGIVRGGTDYKFCAFPLGGYVLMAGEEPSDTEGSMQPGSFDAASIGARARIAVAGPAVNIVFALVAVWILSMVGVNEPLLKNPVIVGVDSASAAEKAGLRAGDTILEIDGRKVTRPETFIEQAALKKGKEMPVLVRRAGQELTIPLTPGQAPDPRLDIGWTGVGFGGTVMAAGVNPDGAAYAAGLKNGDTLRSINGLPLVVPEQLSDFVRASGGKSIVFTVAREGKTLDLPITPRWNAEEKRWMVGVQSQGLVPMEVRSYGPIAALQRSVAVCWRDGTSIFRFLGALLTGSVAPRNLAGPVGIVQMSGRAASEGFQTLIEFMALISINLGILNLMPLVVTDGGKLVELAFEKLRGRKANRKFMEVLTNVVVYCFLGLALYVTFHDALRIPMFLR